EPRNGIYRCVRRAGILQLFRGFRGGVPEFVQSLALPLIRADLLLDPANHLFSKHARSLTGADAGLALRLRSFARRRLAQPLPHFVEIPLLLVVERIIEAGKGRTHDGNGLQYGFQSARDSIETLERRGGLV